MSSDKSFETEVKKLSKYADAKLDRVFKQMLSELFKSTPDDPIQYMIDFLTKYKRNQVEAEKKKPEQKKNGLTNYADSVIVTDEENESTELEDNGDVVHELPKLVIPEKPKIGGRRRTGVSAEPSGAQMIDDAPTRVIPKTEEDKKSILEAVKNNFLFSSLDKDQMKIVLDAMQQKRVKTGDTIIKQGEDGEDFFVLEDGECHCFLNQADGAPPKMVKVYKKGESFGELALMYNCPRMASIKAMTEGKLWAMDRITFRKVLMNTTSQKRQRYERFLSNVPLLVGLHKYERAKIADALIDKGYQDKEYIIKAGDTKDQSFYILEEGVCIATKPISVNDVKDAQLMEVARYKPGDYFGELALITDQPRAANIVSVSECRCVSLDRDSFTRLLGPCEEILKRKTGDYLKTDERLRHERRRTMGNAADLTMSSPTNSTSSKKNGR